MLKYSQYNEAIDIEKLKSFAKPSERKIVKSELNPVVWDGKEMKEEIRERLMIIAEDFFDGLELDPSVKYSDIILIGSMANYNWHRNSDFDLHIVVDYKQINENEELVKEYLQLKRKAWNDVHNIYIVGYPVEVSLQGDIEELISSGIYSIQDQKWLVEPKNISIPEGSEEKAARIANRIAKQFEDIQYEYSTGELDPFEAYQEVKTVWKKIKTLRADLEKYGEFGAKNMAFKKLRNDGYIEKITKFKAKVYDKIFSLDLHPELK